MTITTTRNGSALTLQLEGRLDTTTSPQLEAELSASLDGVKQLTKQGQMVVRHVNETIMEVFEVTGFVDILTIEA